MDGVNTANGRDGHRVGRTRHGEGVIAGQLPDEVGGWRGGERARYRLVDGDKILEKEGDSVKAGETIAEWDPYTTPIVTEVGGSILSTEATVVDGKGKLTLTGKLGDVMQESARAAMSSTRSRSLALGLSRDF